MIHTFKKQLYKIFLLAVSTTVLAACNAAPPTSTSTTTTADKPAATTTTAQSGTPDKKAKQDIRVQLPFLKQSLDAPLIWAIEKGYFAEEGLNVSYERGFGNADTRRSKRDTLQKKD
jgi:NitT/TauT family transport system substrate-binding protein